MSGTAFKEDIPPQHHVHNSNEPLPGSPIAQQQYEVRYSDENLSGEEIALTVHAQGRNAFNSERPLDVQPTSEGGYQMFLATPWLVLSGSSCHQVVLLVVVELTFLRVKPVSWTKLLERLRRLDFCIAS